MAILSVKNIRRSFGKGETMVQAVRDVSFFVESGEIVLIMGPSGSGKTTLLTMLGGLLSPTSGTVEVEGKDLGSISRTELAQVRLHSVGFVFQAYNLLQNLTALENVQYAAELAGIKKSSAEAQNILERLHLVQRLHAYPSQLSGGEQQRVSIARALVNSPKLVLADEPTGNLDSRAGHEVMMLLHNIAKEEGRSVVIVSHDQRIRDIADRTLWIEDGRISQEPPGSGETVLDPVCGIHIDARYPPFSSVDGRIKFCSEDCLQAYQRDPKHYTDSQ